MIAPAAAAALPVLLAVTALLAVHAYFRSRAARLASACVQAREAALVDAAGALAAAARRTVADVRAAVAATVHASVPAVDALLVYEEHGGALVCVYAHGERVRHYAATRIARDDDAPAALALRAGHRISCAFSPAASALAVPLALEGGRACALVAVSAHPLDRENTERIVTLAGLAGPAYMTALEREEDRQRAAYDGLTGLLTPAEFRRVLAAALERVQRRQAVPCALLFVDTDRFKAWNDSFGHASGDALLRALAAALRVCASDGGGIAARNGGDEFCVFFEGMAKADAIERAEALRASIAALDLRTLRPPGSHGDVPISVSVGVAAYPADARSAPALLEAADAAMYHAKRSGRDGVAFAGLNGSLARLEAVRV